VHGTRGIADLRRALEEYQAELGLSTEELAGRLGVCEATLSLVKSGKREPGAKLLRALARNFPDEMHDAIWLYLSGQEYKPETTAKKLSPFDVLRSRLGCA